MKPVQSHKQQRSIYQPPPERFQNVKQDASAGTQTETKQQSSVGTQTDPPSVQNPITAGMVLKAVAEEVCTYITDDFERTAFATPPYLSTPSDPARPNRVPTPRFATNISERMTANIKSNIADRVAGTWPLPQKPE